MNKKHVAIIGTVGLPACYGGFESLVENLVDGCEPGIHYTVYSSSKSYTNLVSEYKGADIKYIPLHANGVQSIPYDILSMIKAAFLKPDVALILGVSGCIFLPLFRLVFRGKIITNIDGLEWKRAKWGNWTKKFLKFSEKLAVRFSDIVVADNQAITDYVRTEYDIEAKTIAYGGDHAVINQTPIDGLEEHDYFLSLCRIEPENNVAMILEAFASKPEFQLKFVGNWDKSDYGRGLKKKYSTYSNIEILDPIYNISVLYRLRAQCLGYVHGHSAGGTNPSLVEAMHFSRPILAFDCLFNRFTTENQCRFFSSSLELSNKLDNAAHDIANGKAMYEIANRLYTWSSIRNKYENLYD